MWRSLAVTSIPLFFGILFLTFVGLWAENYEPLQFWGKDSYKWKGCGSLLSTYYEACGMYVGPECYCPDPVKLSSLMGCFDRYGMTQEEIVTYAQRRCHDHQLNRSDYENALQTFYKESVFVNVTGRTDMDHMTDQEMEIPHQYENQSVIVDFGYTLPDLYIRIYTNKQQNHDNSIIYAAGGLGFWIILCILAGIANWTVRLIPSTRTFFDGAIARAWRKHITLPALIHRKHSQDQKVWPFFHGLVPTRFESLVVGSFLAYTFVTQIVHIYVVPDDPFWDRGWSIAYFVGIRSGIPSLWWTILIVIFGGRSNVLQWVTGWKFSTFVMYHRWIARIVVLLAIVHSACFTYVELRHGNYFDDMKTDFLIYGTIATVAGCLLCFQGMLFLRRKYYEIFLYIHIALAALWMMGCWVHVLWFGSIHFMIAACCLWVADRVFRFVKMGYFGIPMASLSLVEGDTLKVIVPKSSLLKVSPGGHCWLYFGFGYAFWQNHPFCYFETEDRRSLVFLCKIKRGLTKKIGDHLASLPDKKCRMRVGVEGCYGDSPYVARHTSLVYIAGGHGFPGIYSEAKEEAKVSAEKQKIKLYWIIKDLAALSMVWQELRHLAQTKIETTIFVTRPELSVNAELPFLTRETVNSFPYLTEKKPEDYQSASTRSLTPSTGDDTSGKDNSEKESVEIDFLMRQVRDFFLHIRFIERRPQIDAIIEQEIEEAKESVAFNTCGHPAMVDDIRAGVVSRIDSSDKRVDYFQQLQVWT